MKKISLALIMLIIVGICITSVSGEVLTDDGANSATFDLQSISGGGEYTIGGFRIYNIQDWDGLYFVYCKSNNVANPNILTANPSYDADVTLMIEGDVVGSGTAHYNALYNNEGRITGVQVWLDIDDWHPTGYTGMHRISIIPSEGTLFNGLKVANADGHNPAPTRPIGFYASSYLVKGTHLARSYYYWENVIDINDEFVYLTRNLGGNTYISTLEITSDAGYITDTSPNNIKLPYVGTGTWTVTNPYGRIYSGLLVSGTPQPIPLRTGTVTMTDHNGTTISGFEVKAVNYYTGEEYTVSTDTDVATITLPMDQTTTRRHTQTGEYVEVPIGYYIFYGYKSGYKMTSEDGIRVSVLPEEYQGSYQLCDIIVTPEDGYLTGRHKFQLRSRSDNSILQTGTISAQSATTGEWYNTTVYNGMATLILPYDTSDMISKYVGNYFVYGSSPGYLDSEYAVRVSVRPSTQDEIWGIYLTPIGGVPEPGNVTLRIQAITETGQGIPNAEVFIKGVDGPGWELWETYKTSSTGYAEIFVPENSIYDITVSATGYTSSSQRIEVTTEDPPLLHFMLYLSGWVTPEPTTQPTGWITPIPTTQPPGGVPGDDGSQGFLSEAIRGISRVFGVGFATGKTILGMLLALAIGFTTAKHLRGGAAEFGLGLLGGTMLGVLIGLLPVWTVVVLLLIVGMYIGYRYVGGGSNG